VVRCKARSRSNGYSIARERNAADGLRVARPQGTLAHGLTFVAALANGTTIACAPRLGLIHVQGFCGMTYV